jgi:hypothetical protein
LQDKPSQDKENVPPCFGQEPTRKQRKVNRCNPIILKGKWISEALEKVIAAIEIGTISLRKTSRH